MGSEQSRPAHAGQAVFVRHDKEWNKGILVHRVKDGEWFVTFTPDGSDVRRVIAAEAALEPVGGGAVVDKIKEKPLQWDKIHRAVDLAHAGSAAAGEPLREAVVEIVRQELAARSSGNGLLPRSVTPPSPRLSNIPKPALPPTPNTRTGCSRFGCISLVGVAVAAVFASVNKNHIPSALPDVVPSEFIKVETNDTSLLGIAKSISHGNFTVNEELKTWWADPNAAEFQGVNRPGLTLAAEGVKPKHPVIMVPGITSTGLELWKGRQCMGNLFRDRIWGGESMIITVLKNLTCWLEHMALDMDDGLDPEGVRVRAVQGFRGADYVIGGYWVWAKMIQGLADIGYDSWGDMALVGYDWRLDSMNVEKRDGYYTMLKHTIQAMHEQKKHKVVLCGHSMGASMVLQFMNWVEHPDFGNSPGWVDQHIEAFTAIGGAMLGAISPVAMIASGQSRDTAMMGQMGDHMLDLMKAKGVFADLWRTWGSIGQLFPKGGTAVWGNSTDPRDQRLGIIETGEGGPDLGPELLEDWFKNRSDTFKAFVNYDLGVEVPEPSPQWGKWANPLVTALPRAPNLRMYAIYGVGLETERGYRYVWNYSDPSLDLTVSAGGSYSGVKVGGEPSWTNGVAVGDGDGTVPLISLGYMCLGGWGFEVFNPSQIKCTVREKRHHPTLALDGRGGAYSAKHVESIGNVDVISDMLKIVSGADLEEEVHSQIEEISKRINKKLAKHLDLPLPVSPEGN